MKNTIIIAILVLAHGQGCKKTEEGIEEHNGGKASIEAERVVRIFSWEEYFDPETLAAFESETGIRVEYQGFSTTDEMVARLESQPEDFDVVVVDDSLIAMLKELRVLRRIDHSKLPNIGNLDEKYLNLEFDPENEYSLPYLWGTTGIGYRSDLIPDPEKSWNLLWDERLKGKVMMYEERHEAFAAALLKQGEDLNSEEPDDLDRAAADLKDQALRMEARYGDDADVREGLGNGTIWAAMCYSGDAYLAAEVHNENIAYFIPEEGAPLWVDSFVISRDTPHEAEALAFLDYMMLPEAAAGNANYLWYSTPNKAAVALLNGELREDANIMVPEDVLAKCSYHSILSADRQKRINIAMREVLRIARKTASVKSAAAGSEEVLAGLEDGSGEETD